MKFPKQIFAKIVGNKGDEYIDPHHEIDTTVDAGESAKIGVYELREIVTATGSVTTVSTKATNIRG